MLCLMQMHVYQKMAEVVLSCTLLMSLNSSSIGQGTKSPTWYKTVLVTAISNIEALNTYNKCYAPVTCKKIQQM